MIYEIGGTLQVVELHDGTHGDGGGQKMDQVLKLRKEERKIKMGSRQRYNLWGHFVLPIKTL